MATLKKIKSLKPEKAAQFLAKQVVNDRGNTLPVLDSVDDEVLSLFLRNHRDVKSIVKKPHASPKVLAHGAFVNMNQATQLYVDCAKEFSGYEPVARSLSILMRLLTDSDEDKWQPKPQGKFLHEMTLDLNGVWAKETRDAAKFSGCLIAFTANEQQRPDDKFFIERLTKEMGRDWGDAELEVAMTELTGRLQYTPWVDRLRNKIASLF